ncbi:MAG: 3-methyl-2-oxobutanoate hydroxymethyltransferase [Dehalococcoidales bacterium]|nr:3-methyl-2-oxobutanoate hydroxymethyltransferase [Dehalococcoidales bacterium]
MIPKRGQLTIHGMQQLKGKRQIIMTAALDYWTAAAAQEAGVDIIITWGENYESMVAKIKEVRRAAPRALIDAGLPAHLPLISDEEAIRGAVMAMRAGADMVYPGAPPERVAAMAKQGIPCHCHVGLVPMVSTWIGGIRAFGKTSEEALKVYQDALAYQEAGAALLEMELVPDRVAAEIAKRLRIPVIAIGSGAGCDGQHMYSSDILGTAGRIPRHAKKYRDFYKEAVAAFKEFKGEVDSGAFPTRKNLLDIKNEEFESFMKGLQAAGGTG